jgi:hypothetical protein
VPWGCRAAEQGSLQYRQSSTALTDDVHERFAVQAIELARQARGAGNHIVLVQLAK